MRFNGNQTVNGSVRVDKRKNLPFLVFLLFFCSFLTSKPAFSGDTLGIRTVVIDPGHGGKDPGCLGKNSHEADVALAISLKLGKMIKDYYGDQVKVVYTRTKDEFVELAERARIANRVKADLFICVHANSSANTGAKGTETYVLGLHKAEAQLKVAQRENDVILVEDNYQTKYQQFNINDPDFYMYITLQANVYMKQSMQFAENIQGYVKGTPHVIDRGVKQAGFLVLHQVNMPSVLVETGFLTNLDEEKILNDPNDQTNIAKAIFKAFVDYKTAVDEVNGIKSKPLKDPESVIQNGALEEKKEEKTEDKKESDSKLYHSDDKAEKSDKPVFKVQFHTSAELMDLKPENFNGLEGVEVYKADGIYKYTYGKSDTFEEAKKWQDEIRAKGYKGAFVVAFLNGERIDVHKAKTMAQK